LGIASATVGGHKHVKKILSFSARTPKLIVTLSGKCFAENITVLLYEKNWAKLLNQELNKLRGTAHEDELMSGCFSTAGNQVLLKFKHSLSRKSPIADG